MPQGFYNRAELKRKIGGMVSIKSRLSRLTWTRAIRVAVFVLVFFLLFDAALAKMQYLIVPRLGRRNPRDSSAYLQLCYESLPRKAPCKRIFFFGDSTVQGSARILQENAVPPQLEVELRKRPGFEDVRVYNFGLLGAMPWDLLAAFLMFREHECTAVIVEMNHRQYGLSNRKPKEMNSLNLLANLDRETIEKYSILKQIDLKRDFSRRCSESLVLTLRKVWFFYRFRGLWRGYFRSYDFKRHVGGERKHGPIKSWRPEMIDPDYMARRQENYRLNMATIKGRDDHSAKILARLFDAAHENKTPLKFYLSPFDFKLMSHGRETDGIWGEKEIETIVRMLKEMMGPMPLEDFQNYSEALESQVNFIDHEHLVADGCRRLAKLIADDFFSGEPRRKTE